MVFRALRHKNYRIFVSGQSISLTGTWMQQIAVSWLVYRMTNSVFLLGLVGFSAQIATFLLAPVAGVIADRHHRHRILVVTQVLAMAQAAVLYILVVTHTVAVWHIVLLSFAAGVINAFDLPVRQAFTVDIIENREDLGNAIALNSSMVNAAKLLGPSIGGILITLFGEAICFLINAFSYIAVLLSLFMMNVHHRERSVRHTGPILRQLKEGLAYAFHFMPIRTILLLLGLVSFIAGGAQVLMPVFAKDIFHGGAGTLGFLMASSGLGALTGAIYLAGRKNVLGLGKVIALNTGLFGVGMMAFAVSPVLGFCALSLVFAGFGMMVQMAASNVVLQTIVDEDKRGRVMSFYTMAFMGTTPFGSLLAGGMAGKIGAAPTLLLGGICCIVAALAFTMKLPRLRELARPVYIQKGIIPEPIH